MKLVIYIGGELAQEIFVIGEVSMRDVVRFFMYLPFFLLHLPHVYQSCDHLTYIVLIFGLYLLMYVIHLSLHVLFLFSLYAYDSYILYAIYYFCFTLSCHDEFLFKVFQKYRLSKSSCHKLSSCKNFQEFVLGQILLYSISEYELCDL